MTSPRSVNFTALPPRFTSTWRSRTASSFTRGRLAGGESHNSSMPLVAARAASISTVCSRISIKSHSADSNCNRPASIFEKSSTSSTMASSESAER